MLDDDNDPARNDSPHMLRKNVFFFCGKKQISAIVRKWRERKNYEDKEEQDLDPCETDDLVIRLSLFVLSSRDFRCARRRNG